MDIRCILSSYTINENSLVSNYNMHFSTYHDHSSSTDHIARHWQCDSYCALPTVGGRSIGAPCCLNDLCARQSACRNCDHTYGVKAIISVRCHVTVIISCLHLDVFRENSMTTSPLGFFRLSSPGTTFLFTKGDALLFHNMHVSIFSDHPRKNNKRWSFFETIKSKLSIKLFKQKALPPKFSLAEWNIPLFLWKQLRTYTMLIK